MNRIIRGLPFLLLLTSSVCFAASLPTGKGALYMYGTRMYNQKKHEQATQAFQKLLLLLHQEQKRTDPKSQTWHSMTLGQCDALYYLAEIAKKQKEHRRACQLYQNIQNKSTSLPKNWKTWPLNSKLKQRIVDIPKTLKTHCASLPSRLQITANPPTARVSWRTQDKGAWKVLANPLLATTAQQLTLKVEAPGFQTKQQQVRLPRWKTTKLSIQLQPSVAKAKPRKAPAIVAKAKPRKAPAIVAKAKPKARKLLVAATRTPPPRQPISPPKAAPFYQTWWFWTITGVVIVGGTAAAIVAVSASETQSYLKGSQRGQSFQIW